MRANLIRRNSCTNAALQVACGWDQAEKKLLEKWSEALVKQGKTRASDTAHLMGQPGALRVKALLSEHGREGGARDQGLFEPALHRPGNVSHGICKSASILARTCNSRAKNGWIDRWPFESLMLTIIRRGA